MMFWSGSLSATAGFKALIAGSSHLVTSPLYFSQQVAGEIQVDISRKLREVIHDRYTSYIYRYLCDPPL
jgi:hypothetical protein